MKFFEKVKGNDVLISEGISLVKLEKYKDAISFFDKVLKTDPQNTDALYHKGLALTNLEKNRDAISCFEKILETDPNHVAARLVFVLFYYMFLLRAA